MDAQRTNAKNHRDCVVGIFSSARDADRAVGELERTGWRHDRISLITPGNEEDLDSLGPGRTGDKMEKTAAIGGAAGAAVGFLAGSSLFIIPGLGPILFAGAMASGITGGLVGGLVGAMSGWGIEDNHARRYAEALRQGKALLVLTGDPADLADGETDLENAKAEEVLLHAETADSKVDQ